MVVEVVVEHSDGRTKPLSPTSHISSALSRMKKVACPEQPRVLFRHYVDGKCQTVDILPRNSLLKPHAIWSATWDYVYIRIVSKARLFPGHSATLHFKLLSKESANTVDSSNVG